MELDMLEQFKELKDIDFIKKFNMISHTFMLNKNLLKKNKLLADADKGLRNMKWSDCENNAVMYIENYIL